MQAARARVLAACKANDIAFLNQVRANDVTEMIAGGVRVGAGRQDAAEIGRKHTGRTLPY
jgi:hypothetical protein